MGNIGLIRAVLDRYADADGLTEEDVAALKGEFNLSEDQTTELQSAFEDNYIDNYERKLLGGGHVRWVTHEREGTTVLPRLFSKTVLSHLAGSDGFAALKERISRLLSRTLDPSTPGDEWQRSLSALSEIIVNEDDLDDGFHDDILKTRTELVDRMIIAKIPSILRKAMKEVDAERGLRAVAFMDQIAMGAYSTYDQSSFFTRAQASQWMRHLGLVACNPDYGSELRIAAIDSLARFRDVRPTDLPFGLMGPKRQADDPPYVPTSREKKAREIWTKWETGVSEAIFDLVVVALYEPAPDIRAAAREAVRG